MRSLWPTTRATLASCGGWRLLCVPLLVSAAVPGFASETVTYSYDALGRLKTVSRTGSVNNGVQASYSHDAADNRTNVTVTGSSKLGPLKGIVVVPLNGFTIIPIPAGI